MATETLATGAATNSSAQMAAGLARLWVKFLPEIEQRLAVIEAGANSLASGDLAKEQREEAHAAAHKLAGILGTFGLQRGTELARRAEHLLVEGISNSDSPELSGTITELRQVVSARQAGS